MSYIVSAWYPDYDLTRAAATFSANRGQINEINPVWFNLKSDGTIQSLPQADDATMIGIAQGAGIKIVPTVMNYGATNFDPAPVVQILNDPVQRSAHVQALVQLVRDRGYDGIELDYENLPASVASGFTALISELRQALPMGKLLGIDVYAKTSPDQNWQGPGAEHWNELLPLVDRFKIMVYDYSWSTGQPGPIAPLSWTRQVLNYAMNVALATNSSPQRIIMGIPLYGWDWPGGPPATEAISSDIIALKNSGTITIQSESRDSDSGELILRYNRDGTSHIVYYQDAITLAGRLALLRTDYQSIGGVAFWRLGGEGSQVWREVQNYLQ